MGDAGTNCILTASAIEFCNAMCFDLLDKKHTTVIIDKTTGEPVSAKQIEITKVRRIPASDPHRHQHHNHVHTYTYIPYPRIP